MIKWNHMLASVLIASLTVSVAACSKNNASSASSGTPDKQVTLRVEIFDRGNTPAGGEPPNNNNWTHWVQEQFGDPNHIKVEYVTVPRSEEVNKLNVLMAANEAPDIVFAYDRNVMLNYVTSGGLAKLDEPLKQNGPNLAQFLGEDVLKYGKIDGVLYSLPAKRPTLGVGASFIRKDWLDQLGLKLPTTRDELYNVLKAFKEKDPGKLGGKTVPWSVRVDDIARKDSINALLTFDKLNDEQFYTLPDLTKPGYKENVRFFNKLYNEGLLSPNFAIDKDGKLTEQEEVSGVTGFFQGGMQTLNPGGIYSKLQANIKTAELVVADPFEDSQGKHPKWMYDPIGAYHMIPKSSERVKEAIMYLDWLSKPDVLYTLQNGIEGTHYKKDDGGFPVPIVNDETKKTFYNTADITMIAIGKFFGDEAKNIKGAALSAEPKYQKLAEEAMKNSYVDGYIRPLFPQPIMSEAKNSSILYQKLSEILVKSITAKPEQFDKLFEEGVKDYMSAGGTEVMDEKKKDYAAMKK